MLRTYVFSHTTNRIDVELGARLFRHLLQLPLAYFQARRVGDSVARVRELENIRNFLTGSALTLVIDLVFTVVFLAVMFFYSVAADADRARQRCRCYVALIVAASTPILRARLDEKFARGAENQAFLVESVTGIETLKADGGRAADAATLGRASSPAMSPASFRDRRPSATTASKASSSSASSSRAAILWFGAQLVIDGQLTVGELVAFNMLAGSASPSRSCAWRSSGRTSSRPASRSPGWATSSTPRPKPAGNRQRARCRRSRARIQFDHVTFRYRPEAAPVAAAASASTCRPGEVDRHRRPLGLRQEHADQAGAAALRARAGPRADRRRRLSP